MTADPFRTFTDDLQHRFSGNLPSAAQLQAVAQALLSLGAAQADRLLAYPVAAAGQELLQGLAVSPSGGPSLYLVSDGVGVCSPPHSHLTWAVTVGLAGEEVNRLHECDAAGRWREVGEVRIGPGQVFAMADHQVHSTEVAGARATCHLHLYGRSLASLPDFASRCLPPHPGD